MYSSCTWDSAPKSVEQKVMDSKCKVRTLGHTGALISAPSVVQASFPIDHPCSMSSSELLTGHVCQAQATKVEGLSP
eukprot:1139940-Pelagomonas_calceolata.AAC.2